MRGPLFVDQLAGIAALSAAIAALSWAPVSVLSFDANPSTFVLRLSMAVRAAVVSPDWSAVRIPAVSCLRLVASSAVRPFGVWLAVIAVSTWSSAASAAWFAMLAAAEAAPASRLGRTTEGTGTAEAPGEHAEMAIARPTPAAADAIREPCRLGRPSRRTAARLMVAMRGADAVYLLMGAP